MEFVQSLANPNYLHFLAQRGFMKDPCFVNYLNYLTYWKVGETIYDPWLWPSSVFQEPAYVCFLKYPVCLHFLELLQHETFRKEIVSGQCARFLDDQVLDDFALLYDPKNNSRAIDRLCKFETFSVNRNQFRWFCIGNTTQGGELNCLKLQPTRLIYSFRIY